MSIEFQGIPTELEPLLRLKDGSHRLSKPPSYSHRSPVMEPLPFQQAGIAFLDGRDRSLLYDEPGVGKTLQGATWSQDHETVLIVAPKAILHQWADYYPDRKVFVRPTELKPETITILNYEHLSKVLVPDIPFTLIADECHMVKNPKAGRSKLVLGLSDRASKVLAISATPTVNRPIELWPIYLMMKEREPKEFWHWAMRYTGAYKHDFGWDFTGATHLDELRLDMLHFSLRRTLEEVLGELPKIRRTDLEVDIGRYKGLVENEARVKALLGRGNRGESAAEIQLLRQALSRAKVPAAIEWIEQHLAGGGGPVTVFSEFVWTVESIATSFGTVAYTGDASTGDKQQAIQQMAESDKCVFAATFGVGSQGFDGLQHCSHNILLVDLPWVPGVLEQTEGRLQRRGQVGSVCVTTLLAGSEIERKMLEALRLKRDIISYLTETVC